MHMRARPDQMHDGDDFGEQLMDDCEEDDNVPQLDKQVIEAEPTLESVDQAPQMIPEIVSRFSSDLNIKGDEP